MLVRESIVDALDRLARKVTKGASSKAERQTANLLAGLVHALLRDDVGMLGALHSGARDAADLQDLELPYAWVDEGQLALHVYDRIARLRLRDLKSSASDLNVEQAFAKQAFDVAAQEIGASVPLGRNPALLVSRIFWVRRSSDAALAGFVPSQRAQGRCGLRIERDRSTGRPFAILDHEKDRLNFVGLVFRLTGLELDRRKLVAALRARKHRTGKKVRARH